MIIGVDFDNTIVCYNKVFHKVALEKKLIPEDLPEVKDSIRDYLRKEGKEEAWTELQGYVYGPGISEAKPFDGIFNFLKYCMNKKIKIYIISHKTLYPFLGRKYNLHEFALQWLENNGFFDQTKIGLGKESVFLELTKEDKLSRIEKQKCDYYIDDLPEFLLERNFPKNTKKILFDPSGKVLNKDLNCINSWNDLTSNLDYIYNPDFIHNISRLSKILQLHSKFKVDQLKSGRNNKVFKVTYDSGKSLLLKSYFKNSRDNRDRLKTEFSFLKYAWNNGIKCVPEPLSSDPDNGVAMYEFIDGKKLLLKDIDQQKIEEAQKFFLKLNESKESDEGKKLRNASEACFTIRDHLNLVKNRIQNLKKIKINSPTDKRASNFINNHLLNSWNKILKTTYENIDQLGLDINEELQLDYRCISPSDFGFHNAIVRDNSLIFIDFEYAGIDDPAKTICDFFCQPEIPVNLEYFGAFTRGIKNLFKNDKLLTDRITVLFPIYKIKWCCIILNEFLDIGLKRRGFATGSSSESKKKEQLDKAIDYMKNSNLKV